jgi:hypothetical protein
MKNELRWKGPILYRGDRPVAAVAPDPDTVMLWRARFPNGDMSDAMSLARAREEAHAAAELEEGRR